MLGTEFFTISSGVVKRFSTTSSLGAFRWYMLMTNKDGQVLPIPNNARMCIVTDDDPIASDIEKMIAERGEDKTTYYSINGAINSHLVEGINIIKYSGSVKKIKLK